MDLNELEAVTVEPEARDDFVADEDDQQILVDMNDALILLTKCRNIFNYLSDTDLCPKFTKKERNSLFKLSGKIAKYLDEVSLTYTELGD